MSEFVVWFDSSETGAPALNNAAGSLIGVLDACLVTGFNNKAITSIVVAAGVATATCNGHGFSGLHGKDVLIGGVTNLTALNGRKALTFVDTNTFRFATTAADGSATGTITAKRDSLGWVKQFTGTNKAIYKRSDVTSSTMMLRIDDTNAGIASATDARARMVESATDVDTLTALSPTDAQVSGGQFWAKGPNSVTAKTWRLIGDSKRFYLVTQGSISARGPAHGFGDFQSFKAGDAYNCIILGADAVHSGGDGQGSPVGENPGFVAGVNRAAIARGFNQVGGCVLANFAGISTNASGSGTGSHPIYPSPIDSGLLINPQVLIVENNSASAFPARGIKSGICQLIARAPFADLQIVEPISSLPGRKLLVLAITSSNSVIQVAFDITGPWL